MKNLKCLIIIFLIQLLSLKMSAQFLSETEVNEIVKSFTNIRRFQLENKNGVYDKYVEVFDTHSGKAIVFSTILRTGKWVRMDKDFIDFLRLTSISNPFLNDIHSFLAPHQSKQKFENVLKQIFDEEIISFDDEERIDSLIAKHFVKMKQNKNKVASALLFFVGEVIRGRIKGSWEVVLDSKVYFHKPIIKSADGKEYYPYYVVDKFLEGSIPDIFFYIDNYM